MAAAEFTNMLNADSVNRIHLGDHEVDQTSIGEAYYKFVNHVPGPRLKDLDSQEVSTYGANSACDLTERAGAIREPEAENDGVHDPEATSGLLPADHERARQHVSRVASGHVSGSASLVRCVARSR